MAKSKRGLTAALKLTPEVTQFISSSQGETKEAATNGKSLPDPQALTRRANNRVQQEEMLGMVNGELEVPGGQRMRKKAAKQTQTQAVDAVPNRIPFSTRIDANIVKELMRISVERKISGKLPWSQQGIAEAALLDWLAKSR
jgi:hypothetical protein